MAQTQTDYTNTIRPGLPGMPANSEPGNRISRTVEDVAGIAFGKAAFRGAGDRGCVAAPAAGTFLGVVLQDNGIPVVPGGIAADIVPQYFSAGLMNEGVIWVIAGANVQDGQQAYVTPAGAFTNTDNSSANPLIPARFDDTVSSGQPVRLRITRS